MLKVIKFSAVWCGPCRALEPVFERVASSMDDVEFVKVDIDDNSEMASAYTVRAVPTMVFEKDGKVVDTVVGLVTEQAIRDKIEALK